MCSGDDEDDAPGDFSSVFICDWPSSTRRFIACRSAVKFKLTTTVAVPGASRFQLRTWLFKHHVRAVGQRCISLLELDKRSIPCQQRIWIALLCLDVNLLRAVRNRKPRIPGSEARTYARVPLHRCALAVAAPVSRPVRIAFHPVLHIFYSSGRCGSHSNLVAVIHERGATARKQDSRQYPLNRAVVNAIAITRIESWPVMVIEDEQWNVIAQSRLCVNQPTAKRCHVEFVDEPDLHVHRYIELRLVRCSVPPDQFVEVPRVRLANQHA